MINMLTTDKNGSIVTVIAEVIMDHRTAKQIVAIKAYARLLNVCDDWAAQRWVVYGHAVRWAKSYEIKTMTTKERLDDVKAELKQCFEQDVRDERLILQLREELIKLTARLIREERE